jgi:hypothetical protein
MEKATHNSLTLALINKFKLNNDSEFVEDYPKDYQSEVLITQNLDSAKSFMNKYSVNHTLKKDFDPHGHWIGININKMKIKWKEAPLQWLDENKNIYSVFRSNNFRVLIGSEWKLCIIPTSEQRYAICMAYYIGEKEKKFSKLDLTIDKIIEDISKHHEKDSTSKYLLVPHLKKVLTMSFLPTESEIIANKNELDLKCHECVDHYRITIDRHGLYINRLTRNKIVITEENVTTENSCIIKPEFLWIKDINNNKDHNIFKITF